MKLEQQVCTLEQAKRLKELGVDQNCSYLCFLENSAGKYMLDTIEGNFNSHCRDYEISVHPGGFEASFVEQAIAAFTVAELGVMLPSETLTIRRGSENSEYANWEWEDESEGKACGVFATEAEARADHLIMRLENALITPSEVNLKVTQK